MAPSSLAVVGYYDLPISDAITRLETFEAIAGRGAVLETTYQNMPITLYDEAHNANPLSMRAALKTFEQSATSAKNKI